MAHFIDFNVGGFKVGTIGNSSGIFVGQNLQYGWRGSVKFNLASRPITGDYNIVEGATNRVDDPDLLDCWIQKPLPWTGLKSPSPAILSLYNSRKKHYQTAYRAKNLTAMAVGKKTQTAHRVEE